MRKGRALVREERGRIDRWTILVAVVMIALAGSADLAQAQVNVSIGINLPAPPSFVIIPGKPLAYAPAAPANVFFYGGQYWVFAHDAWYVGPRTAVPGWSSSPSTFRSRS